MHRKIMPEVVKEQAIVHLPGSATVRDATKLMSESHISALPVIEGGMLKGIFTERDVAKRVVAEGLNPDETVLSDVMTPNPDTVAPDASASDALEKMQTNHYRHLPVVADGKVVGMVSIRDLFGAVRKQLEEDIRDRESLMFGSGYSGG